MTERKACPDPDCGSIRLVPRRVGVNQRAGHDYQCRVCGGVWGASEVETVDAEGQAPAHGMARILDRMRPSEVGGDV